MVAKNTPRKKLAWLNIQIHARQMNAEPEAGAVVKITGFNAWDSIIFNEERTITKSELAAHLFGDDLPAVGDYVG
jgi:hypothetical protein